MSKKQKRQFIKLAIKLTILGIIVIAFICLSKTIHNQELQNQTLSDRVAALESQTKPTEPEFTAVETTEPEPTVLETEPQLEYIGEFKITGYDAKCEHCCGKSDGITASMTKATVGRTVAMNRQQIRELGLEYGDVIYIEGIGERVIEDTGCKRGTIDVVCEDHAACYKITGYYNIYVKR